MTDAAFWNQPRGVLMTGLKATTEGLNLEAAALRLRQFGPNTATTVRRSPAWVRILGRLKNPLVIILLVASAASAMAVDLASFTVVLVVLLSVAMDFIQEWRAESAVYTLRDKVALRARALRGGETVTLPVADLVAGDIVDLGAGDLVPADCRVLTARDFFINQALLTGEPYPVEKTGGDLPKAVTDIGEATNAACARPSVISGSASLLTCKTGRETAFGGIPDALIAKPPPTAFETDVQKINGLILRITVLLVIVVLAESLALHRPWLQSLMFALALTVSLTPELLPMILTVTLSSGAVRLAAKKVIVKRLAAIHNLGAIDVLCTDKTGLKSALDEAILRHHAPDVNAYQKIDEVPFDFERRRVSVLVDNAGERLLIVKGAPEDVLKLSTMFERGVSKASPRTASERARLTRQFE